MNLLQNIQNILTQTATAATGGTGGSDLSKLLGPAALGGLAGALLTSKAARGIAGGALLAGGGAYLWNKYKEHMGKSGPDGLPGAQNQGGLASEAACPPLPLRQAATPERAERLIRALVFAAKSDGHIDDKEQRAIFDKIRELNLGPEATRLVEQAVNQPLDPGLIASGVFDREEAFELYALSCAVIDVDHFMERSYLDALASALAIPADVKAGLEEDLGRA